MGLVSCEDDFLDRSLRNKRTYDQIVSQGYGPLANNGMAAYSYLREFSDYPQNALLAAASDEADMANKAAQTQIFNTRG